MISLKTELHEMHLLSLPLSEKYFYFVRQHLTSEDLVYLTLMFEFLNSFTAKAPHCIDIQHFAVQDIEMNKRKYK